MSHNTQNVDFDNLTDVQLDEMIAKYGEQDSSSSVHTPTVSPSHSPTVSPSHSTSVHPSHSASVHPSHSTSVHPSHNSSTPQPFGINRSNNDSDLNAQLWRLQKKNEELQRQVDQIASTPKLTPAEVDALFEKGKQIRDAYKNQQDTAEYYRQRAKQREKTSYVDPFMMRPTVAFVNSVPTGNAMCSQTNSRSSFTGIHLMSGCRSNVAVGLIGVYGSR